MGVRTFYCTRKGTAPRINAVESRKKKSQKGQSAPFVEQRRDQIVIGGGKKR